MESYRSTEHGSNGTPPTPDALAKHAPELTRLRSSLAAKSAELQRAEAERDAARQELTDVRRVLVAALGFQVGCPAGATLLDLATTLARDLSYARRSATEAHARRRLDAQMAARLFAEVQVLEADAERAGVSTQQCRPAAPGTPGANGTGGA